MTNFDFSRIITDQDGAHRTADVLVLVCIHDEVKVLLIKRGSSPFVGQYAAPGGFLEAGLDQGSGAAAKRELSEETGLVVEAPLAECEYQIDPAPELGRLAWLGMYDSPDRDPRFRTRSDTYWVGLSERPELQAADDAIDAEFISYPSLLGPIKSGEKVLAFDHDQYLIDLEPHINTFRQMLRY